MVHPDHPTTDEPSNAPPLMCPSTPPVQTPPQPTRSPRRTPIHPQNGTTETQRDHPKTGPPATSPERVHPTTPPPPKPTPAQPHSTEGYATNPPTRYHPSTAGHLEVGACISNAGPARVKVCMAVHTFSRWVVLRGKIIRMSAGAELVARIVDDMHAHGLEPDAKEQELLALAEGLADRLAELEETIELEGLSVMLSSGRTVMNPAVSESRQTRTALATVLGRVSMVEGRAKDPTKVKAAQVRWARHNLAKAQRSG